jgi:hypothetical protein
MEILPRAGVACPKRKHFGGVAGWQARDLSHRRHVSADDAVAQRDDQIANAHAGVREIVALEAQ